MIGLFLCWVAGAYWRKIYYVYITLAELVLLIGVWMGAGMGEDGDYDPVTGDEKLLIFFLIIFLIFILFSYAKNRRIADAGNMFFLLMIGILLYGLGDFTKNTTIIFWMIYMLASVILTVIVFCLGEYSAILPSAFFTTEIVLWVVAYSLTDLEKMKRNLIIFGLEILLTATGSLIQLHILKKTDMGRKKRNRLSAILK